jgi:hypothetical protein
VEEWPPDAAGRYHSRTLGVSFRPEGFFLRIVDPAGNPVPLDHEKADTIARLEQERIEAIRRAEQVEQENAALRALPARLRGHDSG